MTMLATERVDLANLIAPLCEALPSSRRGSRTAGALVALLLACCFATVAAATTTAGTPMVAGQQGSAQGGPPPPSNAERCVAQALCDALYRGANGGYWSANSGWCNLTAWPGWFGVSTQTDVGNSTVVRVGVVMVRNNLSGQLPEFQSLRACYSVASGGTAVRVVKLGLTLNSLSGTLPPSLGDSLAGIVQLDLGFNQFTGTLPSAWGASFKDLSVLMLNNNALVGTLPPSWATLKSLSSLSLNGNELSGPLPPSWSNITTLESIRLAGNNLNGSLPDEWSRFRKLQEIDLWSNALSGTLPPSWANISTMQQLYLHYNLLTGTLPEAWSQWLELRQIHLGNNRITGTLPASWSAWWNVFLVVLSANELTGTLPASWTMFNGCSILWLDSNRLEGTLPPDWLRSAISLNLTSNLLAGTLPELDAVVCHSLHRLNYLYADDNDFEGVLPASWSCLSSLAELFLSNNRFNGTLPDAWKNMSGLNYLHLDGNDMIGTLPESWAGLQALVELQLSSNRIGGPLPSSWLALQELVTLSLENNRFLGTLPAAWGPNMSSLIVVKLARNTGLHGPIPVSWNSIGTLQEVHLRDTCVSDTNRVLSLLPALTLADLTPNCLTSAPLWGQPTLSLDGAFIVVNQSCNWRMYPWIRCLRIVDPQRNPPEVLPFVAIDAGVSFTGRDVGGRAFVRFTVLAVLPSPCGTQIVYFRDVCFVVRFRLFLRVRRDDGVDVPLGSVGTLPSWHGAVQVFPYVPDGGLNITLDQVHTVYGNWYGVDAIFNVGWATDTTERVIVHNSTFPSQYWRRPPCGIRGTVAVAAAAACAICPPRGSCNGTERIDAAGGSVGVWRPSSVSLPFAACPSSTRGCVAAGPVGTECNVGYGGPLCATCAPGFGFSGAVCEACGAAWVDATVVALGAVAVLALVTVQIYGGRPADDERRTPRDARLRAVGVLRAVWTHMSLVGALAALPSAKRLEPSASLMLRMLAVSNSGGIPHYFNFVWCLTPAAKWVEFTGFGAVATLLLCAVEAVVFAAVRRELVPTVPAVVLCVTQVMFATAVMQTAALLRCDSYVFYDQSAYLVSGTAAAPTTKLARLSTDYRVDCEGAAYDGVRAGAVAAVACLAVVPFFIAALRVACGRRWHGATTGAMCVLEARYQPRAWYWELTIMVRQLLVALVVFVIPSVTFEPLQLHLYALLCAGWLGWALHLRPAVEGGAIVEAVSLASAALCALVLVPIAIDDVAKHESAVFVGDGATLATYMTGASITIAVSQVVALAVVVGVAGRPWRVKCGGCGGHEAAAWDSGRSDADESIRDESLVSLVGAEERLAWLKQRR